MTPRVLLRAESSAASDKRTRAAVEPLERRHRRARFDEIGVAERQGDERGAPARAATGIHNHVRASKLMFEADRRPALVDARPGLTS